MVTPAPGADVRAGALPSRAGSEPFLNAKSDILQLQQKLDEAGALILGCVPVGTRG